MIRKFYLGLLWLSLLSSNGFASKIGAKNKTKME